MIEIQFHKPYINNSRSEMLAITFPFDIIEDSRKEDGRKYSKEIICSITKILLVTWGYSTISDFKKAKVLFQFVLNKVKCLSCKELLNNQIEFLLAEGVQDWNQPYDPNKIPNPDGFVIKFDDYISKHKNKMRF